MSQETNEGTATAEQEDAPAEGVGSGGEAEAPATQEAERAATEAVEAPGGDGGEGEQKEDPAATQGEPERVWPEDWREKLAGEDESLLKELRRYKNPENVAKALREAKTALRNREQVSLELPEDATEEQKQALRKRLGVPDALDDYKIEPPRDDMVEADKSLFEDFRGMFHDMNVPPSMAQKLVDAYFDKQTAYEQSIAEHAQKTHDDWRLELKQEFGGEYDKNVKIADTFIGSAIGERGADLVNLTLNDGTKLGNHPDFVRLMVEAGMKSLDDDLLVTAGDGFAGKDLNQEIENAISLQFSDPAKYWSADYQAYVAQLYQAKERRDARNRQ